MIDVRKIGSLFSGIGGLDLATEQAFGGETVWQIEKEAPARRVLARHWTDALQFEDVTKVDPSTLEPVSIVCAGFPCQDLSSAGSRKGLAGERSGLYEYVLRFASAIAPRYVVMENVPALVKYRERVDRDFGQLGYGVNWRQLTAAAVGAPHRRERVFVVAERGAPGSFEAFRPDVPGRGWPTPTKKDADASGSRSLASSAAHSGESLTDAVRPDRYDPTYTGPKLRMNEDWQGQLMGYPSGWTLAKGPSQLEEGLTSARGGFAFPSRRDQRRIAGEAVPAYVPRGQVRGRPARMRAHGNAVVPSQAFAALRSVLEGTSLEEEAQRAREAAETARQRRARQFGFEED